MFERFGGLGFVLYFLMTGGLSLAVVNVSAHIAESTFQGLTIKKSETSQSSRAKSALAKGLETAESRSLPTVDVWPNRPRVEGRMKLRREALPMKTPAASSYAACGAKCKKQRSFGPTELLRAL